MITDPHKIPTAPSEKSASRIYGALAELDVSGSRYSTQDRLTAAANFLVTGNMAQVSRLTGIPETTLSGWRRSEWWAELGADLRSQYDEELDGKLTGVLHNAVDSLIAAIDTGDTVLVKGAAGEHEQRQKPLSGRDLAVVTGIIYDKRALLRRMPTSIRENASGDKLQAMAERFEEIANRYRENQAKVVSDG